MEQHGNAITAVMSQLCGAGDDQITQALGETEEGRFLFLVPYQQKEYNNSCVCQLIPVPTAPAFSCKHDASVDLAPDSISTDSVLEDSPHCRRKLN